MTLKRWAVILDPANTRLRWQAGRSALVTPDAAAEAVALLSPLAASVNTNHQLAQDLILAYAQVDDYPAVLALRNKISFELTPVISDTFAWVNHKIGDDEGVIYYRPNDLLALEHLLRRARQNNSPEIESQLRDKATFYPIYSLLTAQSPLVAQVTEGVLALAQNKDWSESQTLHAARFLVWQYPMSQQIDTML